MVQTILLVSLVVVLVLLMVASYMKKKKYNTSLNDMRDQLKKGDKVLTDSGIVGEVVESYEEEGFKYFVLKSGKGQHVGYYTVHANAIYYVYGKDETSKVAETKLNNKQEEQPVEEVKPEENKEEKQTKKSSKKKSK